MKSGQGGLNLLRSEKKESSSGKPDMYSEKLPGVTTHSETPIPYREKTHLYFEKRYLAYFCSGRVRVYILLPRRRFRNSERDGDLRKTQRRKSSYGSCQSSPQNTTDGSRSAATSLLVIRPNEDPQSSWAPYDSRSIDTTSCWLKKAFTDAIGQAGTRATKFRGICRDMGANRYQRLS